MNPEIRTKAYLEAIERKADDMLRLAELVSSLATDVHREVSELRVHLGVTKQQELPLDNHGEQ